MRSKTTVKMCVDAGMTAALLLLMTYELIGDKIHEWLGVGMFVLFVLHHVLNCRWWAGLLKGKYSLLRVWQTLLVSLVLAAMLGSMVSGVILSRYALSFLPVRGMKTLGRTLHMLSAYWGMVFMALHLGLHWGMMMGMAKKLIPGQSRIRIWALRITAAVIAVYGVYAFGKRSIGAYMLLRSHFVFFDYEEPLLFFLLDYMAVMGLFVFTGHYITRLIKWKTNKK